MPCVSTPLSCLVPHQVVGLSSQVAQGRRAFRSSENKRNKKHMRVQPLSSSAPAPAVLATPFSVITSQTRNCGARAQTGVSKSSQYRLWPL